MLYALAVIGLVSLVRWLIRRPRPVPQSDAEDTGWGDRSATGW
jgi:hypothetical protein